MTQPLEDLALRRTTLSPGVAYPASASATVSESAALDSIVAAALLAAPVGMVLVTESGMIHWANPAYCRFLGYAFEDLAESSFTRLLPEPTQSLAFETHRRFLDGESDYPSQQSVIRSDGLPIVVGLANQRVVLEDGRRYRLSTVQDVSEGIHGSDNGVGEGDHVQSARRLAEFLFDFSPDEVIWVEETGRIIYANAVARDRLGYSLTEVGRLRLNQIVPTLETSPLRRLANTALDEGIALDDCITFEAEFLTNRGYTYPVEIRARRVNVEGQSLHCLFARDIAERRWADQERLVRQARFRALINTLQDGIITIRSDGRVHACNTGAERILGLDEGRIIGRTLGELRRHAVLDCGAALTAEHDPVERTRREGVSVVGEILGWTRLDGSLTWLLVNTQLLECDRETASHSLVMSFNDISERKRIELELVGARDAAQAAARAKDDFLASISHELLTPLNAIQGSTRILGETTLGENQQALVDGILQASSVLLDLTHDILQFARIESGTLSLKHEPFDPRRLVEGLVRRLAPRAFNRQLDLLLKVESGVPETVVGPAEQWLQVISHLIQNAIKFTDRGHVLVELRAEQPELVADQTVTLRCQVTDTGKGIPTQDQVRIFDHFVQLEPGLNRTRGGTGIGLSLSSRLARLMGGQIGVKSRLAEGSTFTFDAPLVCHAHTNDQNRKPLRRLAKPLLLLSESATALEILAEGLAALGVRSIPTRSLEDARAFLDDLPANCSAFSGVLLDVTPSHHLDRSPWVELRDDPRLRDAQFIVLLTPVAASSLESGRLGSSAWCLKKPILADDLRNLTDRLGSGARSAHPRDQDRPCQPRPSPISEPDATLKILLAEDNPMNQRLTAYWLRKRGHSVEIVNNGEEALTAFVRGKFDVVLMDVQMPVLDGVEALTHMRSLERRGGEHQPVIAITAHALVGDRERYLSLGFDEYVAKPFTPEALFSAIDEVLRRELLGTRR